MKKLFIYLYAFCFVLNASILLDLNATEQGYYSAPSQEIVNESFFQKLILKSYDEEETFASIEAYLKENIAFCHIFQFKHQLKDSLQAHIFTKVLQIKAQEAHRFVPVISFSRFIVPCHLGFIRKIKIANNGPTVKEHVLVNQNRDQVIFIEEWVKDANNRRYPGGFAAINSIIEEEGKWYFSGTYFYNEQPISSEIPKNITMFKKTYENMQLFMENEDVDGIYNQINKY